MCSASEAEGEEGRSTMALVQDPDFLSKRNPSKEGRPEGHFCSRADPGSVALTQRAGTNMAVSVSLCFRSSSKETNSAFRQCPAGAANHDPGLWFLSLLLSPFFLFCLSFSQPSLAYPCLWVVPQDGWSRSGERSESLPLIASVLCGEVKGGTLQPPGPHFSFRHYSGWGIVSCNS